MSNQSIAVLLTVHNRKEKTLKCLKHLYAQLPVDGYTVDVYMTDDGCTDGTPETVMQEYPEVCIIHGDGALYWNRGMHLAWKTAADRKDYDYYLWLNDDTFLYDDALGKSLASAEETKAQAIIVGATESGTSGKCTYGLKAFSSGRRLIPNGSLQEGKDLNGNFVLVPKRVYQQLGNLDPYFHHARGDTDYGLRAQKKGIRLLLQKKYVGTCEQHSAPSTWCNPDYPFKQRWRALNHPTGIPLRELFHLERRHYGFPKAAFHVSTTIAHCCFPKLWTRFKL